MTTNIRYSNIWLVLQPINEKNLFYMRYIILIFVALYFISCDNEFELVADNKEVPVVYAIVDQADSAQYIRVERVFVDREIAPKEIAQNPDSLYYEDITVKLITVQDGQEYILERVDGNMEGHVREDGIFATSPNFLYKILTTDIPLVENAEIQLSIEGIFENRAITSTTTILEPPFLFNPANDGFVSFLPNRNINIGWTPKGDAQIYTVAFYMNITETKSGIDTSKQLIWVVASNTDKNNIEADGGDFFSFLVGALTKDNSINRRLNSIEFELISGNTEIADYIRVGQANLGITSSGEVPVLSNLSEGLGIFGATHTHRRTGLMLAQESRDSLLNGVLTRDLNFQ